VIFHARLATSGASVQSAMANSTTRFSSFHGPPVYWPPMHGPRDPARAALDGWFFSRHGDVGVRDGRIAEIGEVPTAQRTRKKIDGGGLA